MEQPAKAPESAKPKSRKGLYAVIGAVVIIVVIVVALWAAGLLFPTNNTPGTPVNVYGTGTYASCANYSNCGFDPSPITITHGTKLTWTNNSTSAHTVTECTSSSASCPSFDATPLSPSFNSGSAGFTNGQTYSYTFSTAGTYYYYCQFHPAMNGKVIVT